MKEENRKEILTRDIIKKEIKSLYFTNIRFTVIILSVFIICMLGLWNIHKDLKYIKAIFLSVISVICILSIVCTDFYKSVKYLYKVSRDEFKIVTDI